MVRIAQIGTSRNSHGADTFITMKKLPRDFEIVGFALPEDEREACPERLATFDGYREMTVEEILTDPTIDAVTVETEEKYLTKYALMAARAGKHIHMEKPGGREAEDFARLIETVKEKGLVFQTGYMYRYNPLIASVLADAKAGKYGEIFSVEAQMSCNEPAQCRQWLENYPGGMTFFLGCHLIDLVYRLQGEPRRVIPLNRVSGQDGFASEDEGLVVFEYPRGNSFIKTTAIERGGYARRQLVITGTRGTVELRPLEMPTGHGGQITEGTVYLSESWTDRGQPLISPEHDRYEAMMADFAAMVRGEVVNPYTPDYELGLHNLIVKCCERK